MNQRALLLAAHGSHKNADSGAVARRHAATLAERGEFAEVAAVFWKEFPSFRDARYLVESETVVVVPLFMADGYFSDRVVPRELELDGPVTHRDGQTWLYTPPVGTDERMIDVILHRARGAVGERPLDELTLLVVGHGTIQNRNSEQTVHDHVARLRATGRFAAVEPGFLEYEPEIHEVVAGIATEGFVVVPLFVADGLHTDEDIPAALGLQRDAGGWRVPSRAGGKTIFYTSAVGTDETIVDVIVHRASEALAATAR